MNVEDLIKKAQKEQFEGGDLKLAEELLLKAAEMGSGHAAHELGVLYIVSGEGVERNIEKAQFWLNRALESGFEATIATDPAWFQKKST